MKKQLFILLLLSSQICLGQSITIDPKNSNTLLDVNSTSKAVKLPAVSTTTSITNPQKGMVVFDDATGTMSYFNGSQWVPLSNSSTGWAVSGGSLSNTNAGNVGIGTSSPSAKFHVRTGTSGASTSSFSSATFETGSHNYINILSPINRQSGFLFTRPSSPANGIIFNTDNSLFIQNNGGINLQIEADGKVGIGTTNPAAKAHVYNGFSGVTPHSNSDLVIEDDDRTYLSLATTQSNETGILFALPSNSSSGGIMYNNGARKALQFRTRNNQTQMTLDSLGTVELRTGKIESDNHTLTLRNAALNSSALDGFNLVPVAAGSISVSTVDENSGIVPESSHFVGSYTPFILPDSDTSDGSFFLRFSTLSNEPNSNRLKLIIYSFSYDHGRFSHVSGNVIDFQGGNDLRKNPPLAVSYTRVPFTPRTPIGINYIIYAF